MESSTIGFGAVLFPNAPIENVLAIARDYYRYAQIYKPGVVEADKLSWMVGDAVKAAASGKLEHQ